MVENILSIIAIICNGLILWVLFRTLKLGETDSFENDFLRRMDRLKTTKENTTYFPFDLRDEISKNPSTLEKEKAGNQAFVLAFVNDLSVSPSDDSIDETRDWCYDSFKEYLSDLFRLFDCVIEKAPEKHRNNYFNEISDAMSVEEMNVIGLLDYRFAQQDNNAHRLYLSRYPRQQGNRTYLDYLKESNFFAKILYQETLLGNLDIQNLLRYHLNGDDNH